MARKTLLALTQNILSSMDSDEINSIGDTVESLQVAEVIAETYEYLVENTDIPGRAALIKLDSSSDPDRPNVMKLPAHVDNIEWVRYDGKDVIYLEPEAFIAFVLKRSESDLETIEVDDLLVRLNAAPRFYTSFNDEELFFDGYDSAEGSTLQQSKTMCWGQLSAAFEMRDDFIPLLPPDMFPRLLSEAKAACFVNFKGVANALEERRARQQKVANQNNRHRTGQKHPMDRLPNYGKRAARAGGPRGGLPAGSTVTVNVGTSYDYSDLIE
jgi:hypothetical protein